MPTMHTLRVFVNDEGKWGNPLAVFLDGFRAAPAAEHQALATGSAALALCAVRRVVPTEIAP